MSQRLLVLDTETTGLNADKGDRIVEIGIVALEGRTIQTSPESRFHVYINPEKVMDQGAIDTHNITNEFLADKPKFAEIAESLVEFIKGGTLVIHNAPFDVGFLNAEFARLGLKSVEEYCSGVIDTIPLAKQVLPGRSVSLDNICRLYGIDLSVRAAGHGALIDAELLAQAYLAMSRGQVSMNLSLEDLSSIPPIPSPDKFLVRKATAEELAEHERIMDIVEKKCKGTPNWRKTAEAAPDAAQQP